MMIKNINEVKITLLLITIFIYGAKTCSRSHAEVIEKDSCPADENYRSVPCSLYLAESTIKNGGLGLFAGVPTPRGVPIGPSDIAIHLVDFPTKNTSPLVQQFLESYVHDGHVTGGQFEGQHVLACLPGIGMIANGKSESFNAIPYRPDVNEADVPRTFSPGAGAISHYYNMSFFALKDIHAGEEIFVKYTDADDSKMNDDNTKSGQESKATTPTDKISLEWLAEHGICMDNLVAKKSKRKDLGRGAVATRFIPEGEIITTSPLLIIDDKNVFNTTRKIKTKKKLTKGKQLILNYAFGHTNSTVLLYPYGPIVNFINHESNNPNAQIRWSTRMNKPEFEEDWQNKLTANDINTLPPASLMIDYVATRNIYADEEIFIDYGLHWENAWKKHVQDWSPPPNAEAYAPSYVMDDVVSKIRTVEEQQIHPYPDNLMTACFYRYTDYLYSPEREKNTNIDTNKEATAVKWRATRGIFNFDYLRPCKIISRTDNVIIKEGTDPQSLYMVMIQNRRSLPKEEKIPKNEKHIVSHVPRHAIRFADKLYTTDQHLENAFRNPIGMPDGMFPNGLINARE